MAVGTVSRRGVSPEQIARAKEVGIEDYILHNEPNNVRRVGRAYYLKDHDSLEISNGLWNWHSRGVGGKNVIDYLINVRGYNFVDAVRTLAGDDLDCQKSDAQKARALVAHPQDERQGMSRFNLPLSVDNAEQLLPPLFEWHDAVDYTNFRYTRFSDYGNAEDNISPEFKNDVLDKVQTWERTWGKSVFTNAPASDAPIVDIPATYAELRARQQKELSDFPKFFALNSEQFAQGMLKLGLPPDATDKVCSIFRYSFMLKMDGLSYREILDRHKLERRTAIQDRGFAVDTFAYLLRETNFGRLQDNGALLIALDLTDKDLETNQMLNAAYNQAVKLYMKDYRAAEHGQKKPGKSPSSFFGKVKKHQGKVDAYKKAHPANTLDDGIKRKKSTNALE